MGCEYKSNGLVWWSNYDATFDPEGTLQAVFLSGAQYKKLRGKCGKGASMDAVCWAEAGLDALTLNEYGSGTRLERTYLGDSEPDAGGTFTLLYVLV